jgi:hypothetical protein
MNQRCIRLLLLAGMVAMSLGCGGDGDDSASAPLDPEVSALVTASSGATVSTESDSASIDIPAGALADDLTITIVPLPKNSQPDKANLGSNAFEFGPDGTQFAKPVTLTLDLSANVPNGKKAQIAMLEGDSWQSIAGSVVADKKVSAPIEHFSTYVILFVGDETKVTTAECSDLSFSACGGSLTGTWKVVDVCLNQTIDANPFASVPACQSSVFSANIDYQGTIDFGSNGSYRFNVTIGTSSVKMEFSDACLKAATGAAGSDICTTIGQSMGSCTYASGVCKCEEVMDETADTDTDTGTYQTSGSTLTITSAGDSESSAMRYCVQGSRATMEVTDDNDQSVSYLILTKK